MLIINDNNLSGLSLQRVNGTGELSVQFKDGRSRISRLYQEGAAKIRMPQAVTGPLEAILINTSGGLTGGDRLKWDVALDDGASAVITTQACERIYRSGGGEARIATRLKAAKGTRLAWLPQETILFNRSILSRRLDVELEEGAQMLVVEATVFGRLAMGERVVAARFADRWRVRLGGRVIHAEEFRLGPDVGAELQAPAVAGGACAMATVLMVCEQAGRHLETARAIIGEEGGCSLWRVGKASKLVVRLYAPDSYALRRRLCPLVALLNGKAGLPKVWTI
ncbi:MULTISPECIES: urease accessory protein UreD [Brucella]|uniref:Urease accessory protein UreD 1 n=11 Tax=Pseudomonadota TaxID=1224 RepID=URED1_BRUC2|nr:MULTISPECIES: urease accessory protein UreD [Brucella]A5VNL0.1 RecName: Full=Urease accessory protein UreD 1 [Brucella ovis ATCC 25840]A9M7V2.1 RecName: Full=Urease accessory protein UreD 1 [Brucella canis ATCC 23365]Q8G2Q1.1 RecName: Full=Urease accessory protein UreD 1 [Brucella suis 1330]AAN29216.1 urease accessory protein UreD [Brucella suis 1330]ABQ60929.1 urease accessory protein UreD [Brucella ovis ATCC 25840]ABX61362.1 Urease accessory protein ureD [Brucella canis ATCC 23365]ACU47